MDDLMRKILGIVGYVFAGLLVAFTAVQTYGLLYGVSGSHITAVIGLVLFEGGMIYWWMVFRREAQGLFQMAISFMMFVAGLLMVTAAVALHLGAVDPAFLGTGTPARIIIVATLLNMIAKLAYPLVHPDVFTTITERAHEGKILNKTYARFETKIDDIADDVSDTMAEQWKERTRGRIMSSWEAGLNKRGQAVPMAVESLPASVNGDGSHPTTRPPGR